MRRILLPFLALMLFAPSLPSQAKHPFTFEDMMKLKRVGDPQVSPDGKWVIFSGVDVDLAANTRTPHVWIVPTRVGADASSAQAEQSSAALSSPEHELISDQDADRPRWAPDGKRFAFLSTKEGGSQIWIAEFDNTTGKVTDTHRLTNIATEAGGELWSPNGSNILFTSDVYPECDGSPAEEQDCNTKKLKEAEQSKVKAQLFTHLLYRHWNAYKEGKRSHIFVISAINGSSHGYDEMRPIARDLTPGDYDAPVFSLGGQDDYAFSPDGKEICYTSNHDKNPAASTNNDLWIVPVDVGTAASAVQSGEAGQDSAADSKVELRSTRQPEAAVATNEYVADVLAHTKNITADNPASDSTPLYSPDGRYIAYRAQQRPGYESDRFRLMLYDRKTGKKKNLTESFDLWVDGFAWAPNSTAIYFDAEKEGSAPVWSLDFGGQYVPVLKELFWHGANGDIAVTPDSRTLVLSRNTIDSPVGLFSAEVAGIPAGPAGCGVTTADRFASCPEKLTLPLTHSNNALLHEIAMSPLDPFWFTGAHGDKVEGFLVKPPNFDASKKYPVKFLIHGGPEGAWGDDWSYRWNPELFAANGYVVLMINFHGSTGYGQKFIDAINGDWGGAPFEDLMKGLDYAEQTYPFIDKNRECALGASYGGYMINWIEGHTDRFKCLVSHDGMFNAEAAWGATEELWFNDWEFKGTPYDNREMYRKWSPHEYAKNFKTPMLVIHGQRDYRLDVSQGFDLFTTLQMLGVPSEMLYFPDEGHWVLKPQNAQLWYKTVNDWVDRWIGK